MIQEIGNPRNLPKDKPLIDGRGNPLQAEKDYPAGLVYVYHQMTGGLLVMIDPYPTAPAQDQDTPAPERLPQSKNDSAPAPAQLQKDSDRLDPEPAPAQDPPADTPQAKTNLSAVLDGLTFKF